MPVLRKIVAFLLLFVMMFCIAKNSAMYAFYKLNTDAFISLFCENKAKPFLKCNGKCQLAKMAKEQQKGEAEKVLLNLQKEISWFYQYSNLADGMALFTALHLTLPAPALINHYTYLYFFRDDKPPQFLS